MELTASDCSIIKDLKCEELHSTVPKPEVPVPNRSFFQEQSEMYIIFTVIFFFFRGMGLVRILKKSTILSSFVKVELSQIEMLTVPNYDL